MKRIQGENISDNKFYFSRHYVAMFENKENNTILFNEKKPKLRILLLTESIAKNEVFKYSLEFENQIEIYNKDISLILDISDEEYQLIQSYKKLDIELIQVKTTLEENEVEEINNLLLISNLLNQNPEAINNISEESLDFIKEELIDNYEFSDWFAFLSNIDFIENNLVKDNRTEEIEEKITSKLIH